MKHLIYTVDIASTTEQPTEFELELLTLVDSFLESHPQEFEDWKTNIKREERVV